jgi:hypothetical protein
VEVWVDGAGRVRKEALTLTVGGTGDGAAAKMAIEFFKFGVTPSITAPSGSEVYDLTQQALQGLSAAQ